MRTRQKQRVATDTWRSLGFDEDSIKNERASLETPFSHYKPMGFFRLPMAPNSVERCPIWPKFELIGDCMPVLVTCKFQKDLMKTTEKRWRHRFLHYKSIGAFCCHKKLTVISQNNICQDIE